VSRGDNRASGAAMFRGTLFTIVSSGDVAAFDHLVQRQPRLDLKMKMGEHGQSNTSMASVHISLFYYF
jgi:hypothetical protein